MSPCSINNFLLLYVIPRPTAAPYCFSTAIYGSDVRFFLLYYCCRCVVLLSLSLSCSLSASVCVYCSHYLPVSHSITSSLSIPLRLLRDRLLLALAVFLFNIVFLFFFAEALISASHCCLYSFSHFSSSTTTITSLSFSPSCCFYLFHSSCSYALPHPSFSGNPALPFPLTLLPSLMTSFLLPSLLHLSPRLSLRPQDVRRCPVGPEVKPRLSTSHPTRHFDSSISSLCVVCVVLSVGRQA